jgi:bacterial/archaeal transporter family-2 protein
MKGVLGLGAQLVAMLVALVAGLTMAVQGTFNAVLGKVVGILEATFLVHAIGTLTVILGLFILGLGKGDLLKAPVAPWYTLLGGVLGVLIVYGVAYSIPKVGVALATTAIIVGQVSTALAIDHFGLFGMEKIPFSWLKGAGLLLLAAGAKLMLMK